MVASHLHRRDVLRTLSGAATLCCLPGVTPATGASAAQGASRERIRIGQIGVGHAHASKLSVYRQSPDYEVVGLVEPDAALRQRAAEQAAFRDLPWMTQEQLLNVPGLQAVLVETRVRDLLAAAESCVSAGKHIHLDKPAGESLPHFRRIMESARQQKLLIQMGYMYRYNPAIVMLRSFLQQGWLGDIFEVHAVMSKVVDRDTRLELTEYPGGMMFELGCHVLDLVIGVLGAPSEITPFPRHSGRFDDMLSDNMLTVLGYPRATATVRSSGLEVDGFARRHLLVCGTEGTVHIQPLDDPAAQVTLSVGHGDYRAGRQTVTFPKYVRYVADAADMVAVIRGEKPSDFSYDHDLTVQTSVLRSCGLPLE